jgi:hypothetical protein
MVPQIAIHLAQLCKVGCASASYAQEGLSAGMTNAHCPTPRQLPLTGISCPMHVCAGFSPHLLPGAELTLWDGPAARRMFVVRHSTHGDGTADGYGSCSCPANKDKKESKINGQGRTIAHEARVRPGGRQRIFRILSFVIGTEGKCSMGCGSSMSVYLWLY